MNLYKKLTFTMSQLLKFPPARDQTRLNEIVEFVVRKGFKNIVVDGIAHEYSFYRGLEEKKITIYIWRKNIEIHYQGNYIEPIVDLCNELGSQTHECVFINKSTQIVPSPCYVINGITIGEITYIETPLYCPDAYQMITKHGSVSIKMVIHEDTLCVMFTPSSTRELNHIIHEFGNNLTNLRDKIEDSYVFDKVKLMSYTGAVFGEFDMPHDFRPQFLD